MRLGARMEEGLRVRRARAEAEARPVPRGLRVGFLCAVIVYMDAGGSECRRMIGER